MLPLSVKWDIQFCIITFSLLMSVSWRWYNLISFHLKRLGIWNIFIFIVWHFMHLMIWSILYCVLGLFLIWKLLLGGTSGSVLGFSWFCSQGSSLLLGSRFHVGCQAMNLSHLYTKYLTCPHYYFSSFRFNFYSIFLVEA